MSLMKDGSCNWIAPNAKFDGLENNVAQMSSNFRANIPFSNIFINQASVLKWNLWKSAQTCNDDFFLINIWFKDESYVGKTGLPPRSKRNFSLSHQTEISVLFRTFRSCQSTNLEIYTDYVQGSLSVIVF